MVQLLSLCVLSSRLCSSCIVQLTGVVTSSLEWKLVLADLFSQEASGVDCVIETQTRVHTYHVRDGEVTYT